MIKKALLVGLNAYPAPINSLQGCVNDVRQMERTLGRYYGFQAEDIRILLDEAATREAILTGLDWLVSESGPGDVLVFHYSGHGSQVDDDSGDEWECRDEILAPYDHEWDNPLRDDDLKRRFDRVPLEANLTIVSDSCHSGTINKPLTALQVPRVLFVPPEIRARIAARVAARDADFQDYVMREYHRLTRETPPAELDARVSEFLAKALEVYKANRFQYVDPGLDNVLLAGCQDLQTSADACIDGEWHGAFTYNLVRALDEAGGELTYGQLIECAGAGMGDYEQIPQLECPVPLRDRPAFRPFTDG
jgi:metacaspase-1